MSKTKRTVTKKVTRNSSQTSVDNGIKVIKTAIKRDLSLSEASRTHKFGRNYVSDIKARITDNYRRKSISRETYNRFKSLLKQYETIA